MDKNFSLSITFKTLFYNIGPLLWNTNCEGRLSTVDLLIKVASFGQKYANNIFNIKKELI